MSATRDDEETRKEVRQELRNRNYRQGKSGAIVDGAILYTGTSTPHDVEYILKEHNVPIGITRTEAEERIRMVENGEVDEEQALQVFRRASSNVRWEELEVSDEEWESVTEDLRRVGRLE
jgi:hypothetical protein